MNNYIITADHYGYGYDRGCYVDELNEHLSHDVYHDLNTAIRETQKTAEKIAPKYEDYVYLNLIEFNYISDPDDPDGAPIIDYENSTEPVPGLINGWINRDYRVTIFSKYKQDELYHEVGYNAKRAPKIVDMLEHTYYQYEQGGWDTWPNPERGELEIVVTDYDTEEIIITGWYNQYEIKLFVNVEY